MQKTSKVIQSPSLIEFFEEIVEATLDGWEIDESNPPALYGYMYEVHVLKDENLVEPPKPSRAEILGNARIAKASKKASAAKKDEDSTQAPDDVQKPAVEASEALPEAPADGATE